MTCSKRWLGWYGGWRRRLHNTRRRPVFVPVDSHRARNAGRKEPPPGEHWLPPGDWPSAEESVAGRGARHALRKGCSHFAPITSRNRTKQEQERRINRKGETACCRTLFPQDQRVTGHGHVVLITQRSLVQIQPPQPSRDEGLAVFAAGPFVVSARHSPGHRGER